MATLLTIGFPPLLLLASLLGWLAQRRLTDRHRSRETIEALRLVIGMIVTFAALVLGLLTSTAKSHFEAAEAALQVYGVDLIELDQRLRDYGPVAEPDRAILRAYTAAGLADTWPGEPPPTGDYPRHPPRMQGSTEESLALGDMLLRVDRAIARLDPEDPAQQELKPVLEARMIETLQQRWLVLAAAHPSAIGPFLAVMTLWLVLVFAMFGLSSPANPVVCAAIAVTAVSVSAAMWLIMELNAPLSSMLQVSSAPLREALAHMDLPATRPQTAIIGP